MIPLTGRPSSSTNLAQKSVAPPALTIAARTTFGPLLQREALRHAVVDDRLAVVVDPDHLLAVDPPDRGGVRSNRQAHAAHLPRRVDNRDDPEQDVRRRLVQRVSEVIEVDVVAERVDGMPRERRVADRQPLAVTRDRGELIREVLGLDRGLYGAVGELSAHADWLENEPALEEPVPVGCLGWRGWAREGWRRTASRRGALRSSRGDDDRRAGDNAEDDERRRKQSVNGLHMKAGQPAA